MTQQMHTPSEATTWKIRVAGYGTFYFIGTETEAETMRSHKAQWERGVGHKWRADLARESDKLTAEMVDLWDAGEGVPSRLVSRRRKALQAERLAQAEGSRP